MIMLYAAFTGGVEQVFNKVCNPPSHIPSPEQGANKKGLSQEGAVPVTFGRHVSNQIRSRYSES